jgi:hypothetical protein
MKITKLSIIITAILIGSIITGPTKIETKNQGEIAVEKSSTTSEPVLELKIGRLIKASSEFLLFETNTQAKKDNYIVKGRYGINHIPELELEMTNLIKLTELFGKENQFKPRCWYNVIVLSGGNGDMTCVQNMLNSLISYVAAKQAVYTKSDALALIYKPGENEKLVLALREELVGEGMLVDKYIKFAKFGNDKIPKYLTDDMKTNMGKLIDELKDKYIKDFSVGIKLDDLGDEISKRIEEQKDPKLELPAADIGIPTKNHGIVNLNKILKENVPVLQVGIEGAVSTTRRLEFIDADEKGNFYVKGIKGTPDDFSFMEMDRASIDIVVEIIKNPEFRLTCWYNVIMLFGGSGSKDSRQCLFSLINGLSQYVSAKKEVYESADELVKNYGSLIKEKKATIMSTLNEKFLGQNELVDKYIDFTPFGKRDGIPTQLGQDMKWKMNIMINDIKLKFKQALDSELKILNDKIIKRIDASIRDIKPPQGKTRKLK